MDNQQGGTNPQGGDNSPQDSGNSPQGGDNGPQGGDNAQGNNYEYGQNMGGSQPYYNPYLQNQQNQQPPQGQVPQEQVPQSQSPQSSVSQNQPQPNPYLNQQTPPPAPQVPPQPTQPLQQPMGAPSGYAPQQGQQPQQPPAQPGGPQYYQYPQNDYGAGYPNQPGPGQMAGQPMPRKKSNAGAIIAIVVVVLLVAVLGLVAVVTSLLSLADTDTTASTERTYPSSRVLPTSPHMRVPSTPMPSRTTAPTRGDTSPTVIADDVRAVLPANIANLVIGESCEEDVFSLDDVTPEKLCQLNTNGNSEYANYLGVVTDRTAIADVRRYGDFEEWKSIESAPGHTLKLGFTGPQEHVGDSTIFFDFVNSNTLVTYRMLGNEDAVSQYLVDLGLAQFRDKA
jgi:calcium-binding protein P